MHNSLPPTVPCNKGKITGQKPPLKPQQIWSARLLLDLKHKYRNLALFNLAIDSKLRGFDLVKIRVSDVMHGESILPRASVVQQKTGKPVRFEITDQTREALSILIMNRRSVGMITFSEAE